MDLVSEKIYMEWIYECIFCNSLNAFIVLAYSDRNILRDFVIVGFMSIVKGLSKPIDYINRIIVLDI